MSDRRLLTALIVPAGVLVGHAVVPLLFHSHGALSHPAFHSHGLQPVLIAAAALAGFVGLARSVLSGDTSGPVRFGQLAGWQTAAYAGLELLELSGNFGVLAGQPTLWLGLVVQLVLAAIAVGLIRVGRRVVERLRSEVRLPRRRRVEPLLPARAVVTIGQFLTVRIVRGPPATTSLLVLR